MSKQRPLSRIFNAIIPTKFLARFEFVRLGLCQNYWIWIHMLGCGILARLFILKTSPLNAFLWVAAIAVLVEIVEAAAQTPNTKAMEDVYGSVKQYIYDTLGDIFGGLAIAALILF